MRFATVSTIARGSRDDVREAMTEPRRRTVGGRTRLMSFRVDNGDFGYSHREWVKTALTWRPLAEFLECS